MNAPLRFTAGMILLLGCLAGSALAQAEPFPAPIPAKDPLAVPVAPVGAAKDIAPLAMLGSQTYDVLEPCFGRTRRRAGASVHEMTYCRIGIMRTNTEVTDTGVTITEHWQIPAGLVPMRLPEDLLKQLPVLPSDRSTRLSVVINTNKDLDLGMQQIDVRQGALNAKGQRDGGRMEIEVAGKKLAYDLPAKALARPVVMRMLSLLSRENGSKRPIDAYVRVPSLRPDVSAGQQIECLGADTLVLDGRKVDCTRYRFRDMTAWVRADGVVARLEIASQGLTLELAARHHLPVY